MESPERVKAIYDELKNDFEFVEPKPCSEDDLLLVHTPSIIKSVKINPLLFEVASLAVGGAILTSELAIKGDKAFGLIRPPGHHASPDHHWGFCFFNNMAIAMERLIRNNKIKKGLVLDIDLHFGDGTDNFFSSRKDMVVANIQASDRKSFVEQVKQVLEINIYDIIGISAGFDRYELDWGATLTTEDFEEIGKLVAINASKKCNGRCFALLEGGYYLPDLGKNVKALLNGMAYES